MVNEAKAPQFEGFDFNEYALLQTALILPLNGLGVYVPGTVTNASVLGLFMAATPLPPAGVGPQYPWPYHGIGPSPVALPINVAEVQRTLFRVITNDVNVYFFDLKLAQALALWWAQNPDAVGLGPTLGAWPMPGPVLLQAVVGLYEVERKWIWLFYERTVDDADADLHVYMEG